MYKNPNYQKEYRKKNKEKNKQYQIEYRKENRDILLRKMSEYGRKYYQENKKSIDTKNKAWHQNNRKRSVEIVQKYVKNNKEKVAHYLRNYEQTDNGKYRLTKNRHQKRWESPIITLEDFKKIISQPCKYCGGKNTHKGIDRIKNEEGYTKENSASCCKMCNYMKKDYSLKEFLAHIIKIYKYNC